MEMNFDFKKGFNIIEIILILIIFAMIVVKC